MKSKEVKISFGIIVLNGEPFIKYDLRSLYRFAYEIIIVEGATKNSKANASDDGHSVDATLEVLQEFKAKEDPENKIKIITKNGFWSGKDEQSQAYAQAAKGNYLWQVDIDEFYKKEDVTKIITMLAQDPVITAVSFKQITFFGSPNYKVDSWYLRAGADVYHRLFKWGKSYKYKTHRPPTVVDDKGRDLRGVKWVRAKNLEKRNIYLYHYSLLFPKQVEEKARYYAAGP
ncbi:glycosyltransferase family 2 protein [bacterium]|nr:glycosyltransferase family 2 protein [bacterium]